MRSSLQTAAVPSPTVVASSAMTTLSLIPEQTSMSTTVPVQSSNQVTLQSNNTATVQSNSTLPVQLSSTLPVQSSIETVVQTSPTTPVRMCAKAKKAIPNVLVI